MKVGCQRSAMSGIKSRNAACEAVTHSWILVNTIEYSFEGIWKVLSTSESDRDPQVESLVKSKSLKNVGFSYNASKLYFWSVGYQITLNNLWPFKNIFVYVGSYMKITKKACSPTCTSTSKFHYECRFLLTVIVKNTFIALYSSCDVDHRTLCLLYASE